MIYVVSLMLAGCFRMTYPAALLASQRACADVYKACAAAASTGNPCREYPRCPMTARIRLEYEPWTRELGFGVPWQEEKP